MLFGPTEDRLYDDNAGTPAAKDPTTSWTDTDQADPWVGPHEEANMLVVHYKVQGVLMTKLEMRLRSHAPTGTVESIDEAINSISGGEIEVDDAEHVLVVTVDSVWRKRRVPIVPGFKVKAQFKRTGGDGTSKVIAVCDFVKV